MKLLSRIAVIASLVTVIVPVASAADFGVRAGRYNDGENTFVGGEVAFNIGRVVLNPNVEYIIDDDVDTAGTANFDVAINLTPSGTAFTPWIGAGIGVFYVDSDFGDDTDTIVNAIGGISWNLEFLKPYAQVKYFRSLDNSDADDIALAVGLRF